jgi:hypothetical protein
MRYDRLCSSVNMAGGDALPVKELRPLSPEMVEEAIETLEEAGKPVPQSLSPHELGSLLQKLA